MPFYTWLRPRRGESKSKLEYKRRVTGKLLDLREAIQDHIEEQPLDGHLPVPGDSARVLRLATWNIREFDSSSYGKRRREAKAYIAEILSHFDLIAVQEVREGLEALDDVMDLLGPGWKWLATDVTAGSAGNRERMVYVYNTDKVWFRNVAGEVTLKPGERVTDPFGERFQVAQAFCLSPSWPRDMPSFKRLSGAFAPSGCSWNPSAKATAACW